MAFHGRVVQTYGRLQKKAVKQDNWISPDLLARRKVSNVFSSPDNDSLTTSHASVVEVSEKENIISSEAKGSKRTRRKAAQKATAALQEHVENAQKEENGALGSKKTREKKGGKGRPCTKPSRKYKPMRNTSDDEDENEEEETATNPLDGKEKPIDSLFESVYNFAKQKQRLKKMSCSEEGESGPSLHEEIAGDLALVSAFGTSTPCDASQHSVGEAIETGRHITRRRGKRHDPLTPGAHRHPKRQRVVAPQILSFSEDDSFVNQPRRLRTRRGDEICEVASRLSAIRLDEVSHTDCGTDNESRIRHCSIQLNKLSLSTLQDAPGNNGSMNLFDDDDDDEHDDDEHDDDAPLHETVEEFSPSSGIGSEVLDEESLESEWLQSGDRRPLLDRRKEGSMRHHTPHTPLVNKSLHRLAMDSFKVALTPTRSKQTGKLLTPRRKVLAQCDQTDYLDFSSCLPPAMMRSCLKIGEGVYGEVFRASHGKKSSVALKIIPVEGDFPVNEEPQKPFEEILPEIVISRELSKLRDGGANMTSNFIEVKRVACIQGCYPRRLLDEWDKYDRKKTSENDRPDMFANDQLFIMFEFADGGKDLESFEFANVRQAVSVVQQVTGALAVAERELAFEHRDLHWGNVLVRVTTVDRVIFSVDGEEIGVDSHGLYVSIIDFTLSRLAKDECTVFCNLAEDPTLFTGQGDKQFDVYRAMRKHNHNQWEGFEPKTNVFWIQYLLDKVIWHKKYPSDRSQRKVLGQLKTLVRDLDQCVSAEDVMRNSSLFQI